LGEKKTRKSINLKVDEDFYWAIKQGMKALGQTNMTAFIIQCIWSKLNEIGIKKVPGYRPPERIGEGLECEKS